ncbi:hypothetical protein ACFL56_00225 [Candidatus Margulisiibacteriota bacterium]
MKKIITFINFFKKNDENNPFIRGIESLASYSKPHVQKKLNTILQKLISAYIQQDVSKLPEHLQKGTEEQMKLLKEESFSIMLLDSALVNASIYPKTKKIYIFLGILQAIAQGNERFHNWDNVAFIIAHEISHFLYDKTHVISLEEESSYDSHFEENQCDYNALIMMDNAGFNINFADFSSVADTNINIANMGILASHPNSYQRNNKIREIINNNPWENYAEKTNKNFTNIEIQEIHQPLDIDTMLEKNYKGYENNNHAILLNIFDHIAEYIVQINMQKEINKRIHIMEWKNPKQSNDKIMINPLLKDIYKQFINEKLNEAEIAFIRMQHKGLEKMNSKIYLNKGKETDRYLKLLKKYSEKRDRIKKTSNFDEEKFKYFLEYNFNEFIKFKLFSEQPDGPKAIEGYESTQKDDWSIRNKNKKNDNEKPTTEYIFPKTYKKIAHQIENTNLLRESKDILKYAVQQMFYTPDTLINEQTKKQYSLTEINNILNEIPYVITLQQEHRHNKNAEYYCMRNFLYALLGIILKNLKPSSDDQYESYLYAITKMNAKLGMVNYQSNFDYERVSVNPAVLKPIIKKLITHNNELIIYNVINTIDDESLVKVIFDDDVINDFCRKEIIEYCNKRLLIEYFPLEKLLEICKTNKIHDTNVYLDIVTVLTAYGKENQLKLINKNIKDIYKNIVIHSPKNSNDDKELYNKNLNYLINCLLYIRYKNNGNKIYFNDLKEIYNMYSAYIKIIRFQDEMPIHRFLLKAKQKELEELVVLSGKNSETTNCWKEENKMQFTIIDCYVEKKGLPISIPSRIFTDYQANVYCWDERKKIYALLENECNDKDKQALLFLLQHGNKITKVISSNALCKMYSRNNMLSGEKLLEMVRLCNNQSKILMHIPRESESRELSESLGEDIYIEDYIYLN